MLIKTESGRITDYSIFTTMPPFDELVAVESSAFKTYLSGDTPATVVIVLEDGTILHTTDFVIAGQEQYLSEFTITDKGIADRIAKMFPLEPINEVLEVFLLSPDAGSRYGWSLGMSYEPFPDIDPTEVDEYVFLYPRNVFFTVEGENMPRIADHWQDCK